MEKGCQCRTQRMSSKHHRQVNTGKAQILVFLGFVSFFLHLLSSANVGLSAVQGVIRQSDLAAIVTKVGEQGQRFQSTESAHKLL